MLNFSNFSLYFHCSIFCNEKGKKYILGFQIRNLIAYNVSLSGSTDKQELSWLGIVHVEDVVRAQILLYESPNAKGRHLCTEEITHFSDFAEEVSQLYPHFNVYK